MPSAQKIRSLLATLLLVYFSLAQAQTVPKECATGTILQNGGLDITAFIPNAPCMIAQITLTWGQWGLWTGMAKVGLSLTGALFIYLAFIHLSSGKPDKLAMPLIVAVVVSSVLAPASRGQGLLPDLQIQAMQSFNDVYSTAASVSNQSLSSGPNSVASKVEQLGQNIALLMAQAGYADTIMKQMWAIKSGELDGDLKDPDLVNNLYLKQLEKDTSITGSIMGSGNWAFNIGFLLIYGLFAIFAGIIAAVGLGMQVSLLLAPLGMALLVAGNWKPVQYLLGGYLATLLTVALLPITLSAVAVIGLSIPTQRLLPVVSTMNQDVASNLQKYQTMLSNGCGLLDGTCSIEMNVFIPLMNKVYSLKELMSTTFIVILCVIVGLSIAASLLRRVPANISSMFGLSAGGESSGVETKAASRALGMVGGMMALTGLKQAATRAATRGSGQQNSKNTQSNSGAQHGGSAGSGEATAGGAQSPASAEVVPPLAASQPGSSVAADVNTPPPEVSATHSSRPNSSVPPRPVNPDASETRTLSQPGKELAARMQAGAASTRSRIVFQDGKTAGPTFTEQYQAASGQSPLPTIQPARYADVAAARMTGQQVSPASAPAQGRPAPAPAPVIQTVPSSHIVQPADTTARVHASDALSVAGDGARQWQPVRSPAPAPAVSSGPMPAPSPAIVPPPRLAIYSASRQVPGVRTAGLTTTPQPSAPAPAPAPAQPASPIRWTGRAASPGNAPSKPVPSTPSIGPAVPPASMTEGSSVPEERPAAPRNMK